MSEVALSLEAEVPQRTLPIPSIAEVYDTHVDFVARMARGLGVPSSAIDDVVQDVFLVVHQKLDGFEGRALLRTWIARIVVNVVRTHRKALGKRRAIDPLDDELAIDAEGKTPHELSLEREAVRILEEILDGMSEEQRTVFVLSEIEGLKMHEIAEGLSVKLNTAYSRLRLARQSYERAVERIRVHERWRDR